ncbi:hypothetical protein [Embleya scabrispora]|uniref:hypothetical protein n=1 Tax=Embleya scabrispora TaxID=159449 RepID=UPI00037DA897|nr:hypothetical protein [Embleya scabrispora]MYS80501.1 hypothetical protein [Streptomyces sp. SID5474]
MPEFDVPPARPGRQTRSGADQFVLRDLVAHETKPTARPARRPRSRLALGGVLLGTAALATAAFTYAAVNSGPEYVDHLPDDATAIQHGKIDGVQYWLVPNRPPGICDANPRPGVELISEAQNKVGEQWMTFTIDYGDTVQTPRPGTPPGMIHICDERIDESAWLADPSRWERFATRLTDGGRPVVMTAVHPGVTAIVVVAPDGTRTETPTAARPDRPNGPRYALAPLPTGAGPEIQVELHRADGTVVATHTVPRPPL